VRPYYVEYRLLDLEVREVVAEFGTLFSSTHTRNRFMDVEARVGSYKLDSSNFVSDDGFRGFIGPTGSVGIESRLRFAEAGLVDRDRSGLQRSGGDLFAEAGVSEQPCEAIGHSTISRRRAGAAHRTAGDGGLEPSRNWGPGSARDVGSAAGVFPRFTNRRVTYYLVYADGYLLTSEGTEIRQNRHFAAIEAGMSALADDGVPLNHFYAAYSARPAELPGVETVRKGLNVPVRNSWLCEPRLPHRTIPVPFFSRRAQRHRWWRKCLVLH